MIAPIIMIIMGQKGSNNVLMFEKKYWKKVTKDERKFDSISTMDHLFSLLVVPFVRFPGQLEQHQKWI